MKTSLFHEGWGDIWYIIGQEIRAIKSDRGVVIFFFLVPLIYPFLYASFYNTEVVQESKMVVVDQDNSSLSREYTRRVDASPEVKVVSVTPNLHEARTELMQKNAYGIAVIPPDFSHNLSTSKQTSVALYSDLSSILYYKCYMMALNDVSLSMGRELTAAEEYGVSKAATQIMVRPIENESISFYNPQSGFASFMLPGIVMLILQQSMLLGVCMLAATARERNDKHYLIPPSLSHYRGALVVMLGKSIVYMVVYFVNCLWALVIIPYILRIPLLGSPLEMIVFVGSYMVTLTFFSLSLSLWVRRREDIIIYLVFTSVIFFFLIGISWPWHAIPPFWKALSYFIPSTIGAQGYIALNSMGASLRAVTPQLHTLWLQGIIYFLIAATGYRIQYRRAQRNL